MASSAAPLSMNSSASDRRKKSANGSNGNFRPLRHSVWNRRRSASTTEIWTPSESYLRDGDFRLPRMMSFWEERVGSAIDSGRFEFVRSVGNMSWALDTKTEARELVAYESELNRFLPRYPQAMLCLYDLEQFSDGQILMEILRTHPTVLLSGQLLDNPWYVEPEEYLAANVSVAGA